MSTISPDLLRFDAHPQRHAALGGLLFKSALLMGAAAISETAMVYDRRHKTTEPQIDEIEGEASDRLIIAQFGFNTDDEVNARRFKDNFKHLGEVACIKHPLTGMPIDKIFAKMLETKATRPDADVYLYGHSGGGYFNAAIAGRPDFVSKFGPIKKFIFDSSFGSHKAISRQGNLLLGSTHFGPLSWALGQVVPSAIVPTYQVTSMHDFTRRNILKPGSLEGIAEEAVCFQPEHDPFINNDAAYESIQRLFGDQPVRREVDTEFRPKRSHAGATIYPEAIARDIAITQQSRLKSAA